MSWPLPSTAGMHSGWCKDAVSIRFGASNRGSTSVRVRLVSICTLQASIRATLASALAMIVLGDKCHGIMDYRRLRRLELGLMRDA